MKDELYEKDITYKALVDNYCNSSAEDLSQNLNALANYTNQLRHNNLLSIIKKINFTYEDITEMFEERIISAETLSKMIKHKLGDDKQ